MQTDKQTEKERKSEKKGKGHICGVPDVNGFFVIVTLLILAKKKTKKMIRPEANDSLPSAHHFRSFCFLPFFLF